MRTVEQWRPLIECEYFGRLNLVASGILLELVGYRPNASAETHNKDKQRLFRVLNLVDQYARRSAVQEAVKAQETV